MDLLVYVSKQNILWHRDLLKLESDPARLAHLQKLLIDEEDRLRASYERLEEIDQEIAKADQRIKLQRMLVVEESERAETRRHPMFCSNA